MSPPYAKPQRGAQPKAPPPAQPAPIPAAPRARPAFYLAVIFVFVVFARFPEIMDMVTGTALHSARFLMVLSLLATLLFGGVLGPVFSKVGLCLLGFTAWLCICTPFSVWRGGSFGTLRDFWVVSMFSFFIIATSVQGIDQCRRMMYSLAYAAMFIEVFALVIGRVQGGRFSLLGGTLGNSNYLALMLLIGAPFCLLIIRTKPGLSILKLAAAVMIFTIPVTIAETGSRGGLVTLVFMFVLFFLPLPPSQKVVAMVGALILTVAGIALSTRSALDRYKTIFTNSDDVHLTADEKSAVDSAGLRKSLLLSSVELTLRHPLLGVGPGMFAIANADYTANLGLPSWNAWHETHNTFTQLSCEDGLPGLFLYCAAIFFCFRIVLSAEKKARQNPALASVQPVAYCLRLALVAFTGTAVFASNAYAYYFPMLAGLCVALERTVAGMAAREEALAKPQAPPVYAPPRAARPLPHRSY